MRGRRGLMPTGPVSRVRFHNGTIVWAVPGLGVRRAIRDDATLRRRSMIETARDAELRRGDARDRSPPGPLPGQRCKIIRSMPGRRFAADHPGSER
jgi:hypothetical protein